MYVNNLISLQENISTYGIDNRKVTGHVTLSSPGMIKCYVQNLKPSSSSNEYVFCIFSKHHNKGIKIGKLGTEKETKWLVDEKNILGSGIKLEEIDGVALVAEHEMRGIEAIVVGFSKDRYMLLSLVENLFPRNEQKTTSQAVTKVIPPKSPKSEEKTKVVVAQKEKPVVVAKETMPVEKPVVVAKETMPVEKTVGVAKEMTQVKESVLVQKEAMSVEKPMVAEKESEPVDKQKIIEQGLGPVILPNPVDSAKPKTTECNEYPKAHKEKEKPCACKDFVLPKGATQGELVKETNEPPINEELKRIIDSISKDKRVEEKARELEKRISQMSGIPQSQKIFDKSQIQQTLENRYMSKQINFEELLEEEEQDDLDTNPKKALDCINQMNLEETSLDQEAVEEKNYLKEIDRRLQAIRARMNEAIDKQEIE